MPAKTNRTGFRAVREATLGATPPPTSEWLDVEVNTPARVGSTITSTPREPISERRSRRKGVTTDLDSGFGFQQDLTLDALEEFLEAGMKAKYKQPGTTGLGFFRPTAVVDGGGLDDSFTVAASGALTAGELIRARGFTNAANNAVFKTVASAATAIKVATGTLTAEASPPANAIVEVCGVEGASGDIRMNGSGNLTSEVAGRDFTTLGLKAGQFIKIGDTATGTQFTTTAYNGYARLVTVAANLLTLDKRSWTVGAADTGAGKTIRILYGRFIHDVAVTHADFLDRNYAMEVAFDAALLPGPAAHYMYPLGNTLNTLTIELPLADKAGMSLEFVGTDTEVPTTSRHTGPSTSRAALKTEVVNTSSGIVRERTARIDETGLLTDITDVTITLNQNISAQKVHGTLGADSMKEGNFLIDVSMKALFTDARVLNDVRDNKTLMLDAIYKTPAEGGFAVDIPSLTVGDDQLGFATNEPVTIEVTDMAFQDPTLGYQVSFSLFPHLP